MGAFVAFKFSSTIVALLKKSEASFFFTELHSQSDFNHTWFVINVEFNTISYIYMCEESCLTCSTDPPNGQFVECDIQQ